VTVSRNYQKLSRDQLLYRLSVLNDILGQHGVTVGCTVAQAVEADLPLRDLRELVSATAARLPRVARALKDIG
jgi:hypothetical protein